MPPVVPPTSPFQYIWDDAARRAADGVELPEIVAAALASANAQIEVDSLVAVPAHGRAFFSTLAKALTWAVLLDACVLGIGSFGAGPLDAVRLIICVAALIWAVGFGTLAANQRVQRSRTTGAAAARIVVTRIAEGAAGLVWSSQIPGSWKPLGPPVVGDRSEGALPADHQRRPTGDIVPTRWLRRLGGGADAALAFLTDGSPADLLRRVRASRGLPVVLFRRDPEVYPDETRELADDYGVALFVIRRNDLVALSAVASSVWAAYLDPAAAEPPAGRLNGGWMDAEPVRRSAIGSRR